MKESGITSWKHKPLPRRLARYSITAAVLSEPDGLHCVVCVVLQQRRLWVRFQGLRPFCVDIGCGRGICVASPGLLQILPTVQT